MERKNKIDTIILAGNDLRNQVAMKLRDVCEEDNDWLVVEIIASDSNTVEAIPDWCQQYGAEYKDNTTMTYGEYRDRQKELGVDWEDLELRRRLQGRAKKMPFIRDDVTLYIHTIGVNCGSNQQWGVPEE